jgi:hypothetical protein
MSSGVERCGATSVSASQKGRHMRRDRIPISAVEDLRREFDNAAEHHLQDVSKTQAIKLLLPQIQTMQNKGYGLADIAARLSNKGVVVTAIGLKNCLSQIRSAAEITRLRKGTQSRPTARNEAGLTAKPKSQAMPPDPPKAPAASTDRALGSIRKDTDPRAASRAASAPLAPSTSTAPAAAPTPEPRPRPGGFIPRMDSDEV